MRRALGMAFFALALMLPEGAERGGLGLIPGLILALGLMALAAALLWTGGAMGGKRESARTSDTGSGAQRRGMR